MLTIVESPYLICFSRNPVRYSITTDSALTTPGLTIEVQVWFRPYWSRPDQMLPFGLVLEIPFTPDTNKKISFDFSRVLDSLVNYSLPSFLPGVTDAFAQLGEFYIRYRETTTAAPAPDWITDEANTKTVTKGGLPYERWAGANFFLNFDFPAKSWVTWQPSGRSVAVWEKTWLTYFHLQAPIYSLLTGGSTAIKANFKILYVDGTVNNTVSIGLETDRLKKYCMYRIPAGIEQMNLHMLSTKKIHYYEVRVYADGNPISSAYIFYVDYNTDYTRQQFNYFNSLGGFDNVRVLGEIETGIEHEREMAENNPDSSYFNEPHLVPQSFSQQVIEQATFKGNIGWMESERQQDLLRDLLLSKGVYSPKYSRWWPVNITNKSTSLGNTKNSLRELPIDWSYGFVNENYAPEWMTIGGIGACSLPGTPYFFPMPLLRKFSISWGHEPAHKSFIILIKRNGILSDEIFYTNGGNITLPYEYIGSTIQVRANCGNSLSPYTNPVTLK